MQSDIAEVEGRSNGKSTGKFRLLSLGHLDGRTVAARRARELIESIEVDLGGSDRLSEGTKQLVQRAAVLGTYIENCEAQWLAGEAVALSDYLAAINSQRRVLQAIGLERRQHDVTPLSLDQIADTIRASHEAEAALTEKPEGAAESEIRISDSTEGEAPVKEVADT